MYDEGRKQYVRKSKEQALGASPDFQLMKGVGAQTQLRSSAHSEVLPMPKYTGPRPKVETTLPGNQVIYVA